jgi:hypothetical protein
MPQGIKNLRMAHGLNHIIRGTGYLLLVTDYLSLDSGFRSVNTAWNNELISSGTGWSQDKYVINPATKLVIPAAAERRAGIQKRPCDCWIPDSGKNISPSVLPVSPYFFSSLPSIFHQRPLPLFSHFPIPTSEFNSSHLLSSVFCLLFHHGSSRNYTETTNL